MLCLTLKKGKDVCVGLRARVCFSDRPVHQIGSMCNQLKRQVVHTVRYV